MSHFLDDFTDNVVLTAFFEHAPPANYYNITSVDVKTIIWCHCRIDGMECLVVALFPSQSKSDIDEMVEALSDYNKYRYHVAVGQNIVVFFTDVDESGQPL